MKFIAKLRVWGNWGIGENVLKVFLRFRGSANRRVDLFLPLIASIPGRLNGAGVRRTVVSGATNRGVRRPSPNEDNGGVRRPSPNEDLRARTVSGCLTSAFLG